MSRYKPLNAGLPERTVVLSLNGVSFQSVWHCSWLSAALVGWAMLVVLLATALADGMLYGTYVAVVGADPLAETLEDLELTAKLLLTGLDGSLSTTVLTVVGAARAWNSAAFVVVAKVVAGLADAVG